MKHPFGRTSSSSTVAFPSGWRCLLLAALLLLPSSIGGARFVRPGRGGRSGGGSSSDGGSASTSTFPESVVVSRPKGGRRIAAEPLMSDFRRSSAFILPAAEDERGTRRKVQQQGGDGDEADEPPEKKPEHKPNGDDSCPCLTPSEMASRFGPAVVTDSGESGLGSSINLTAYGSGCAPHDATSDLCLSADLDCANTIPVPPDCDKSWCVRSWCYVDPTNCRIANKPSVHLEGRYYSYATCGYMDSFTHTDRLSSLRGRNLRVAFNSNSGGWRGAYNREGSFAVNHDWGGPVVEFVQRAALQGGFTMTVSAPPSWLRDESKNFFGSSSFDYCVYAASLGYVDLCVAAYTITDKRASVATFFETGADPIYLITFATEPKTTWDTFVQSFLTIFQPFTTECWIMILLFCLPVLGLLMLFHEYDAPGSAYPRTVPMVVRNVRTGRRRYKSHKVKMFRHIFRSLYMAFLAFFQESYDQSVVTPGGKANLLAISSFILLVLAVYTANLAAILTSDISTSSVSSLEDAIIAGYNFCSERKVAEIVMGISSNLEPSMFIPDPTSLGGDGLPGFNCPNCAARSRVFDYMKLDHSDPSLYCNAAFASWEDLQVLHSRAQHCDKQRVGDPLAHQNIGIPLSDSWSDSLLALFHSVQNEGVMAMELAAAEPDSVCPVREGEGNALSVRELTGIWVIVFSFALMALLIKLFHWMHRRKAERDKEKVEESLQQYDQWGNPTSHEVHVEGKSYAPDSVRDLARTLERTLERSMSPANRNLMATIAEEVNEESFRNEGDEKEVRSESGATSPSSSSRDVAAGFNDSPEKKAGATTPFTDVKKRVGNTPWPRLR